MMMSSKNSDVIKKSRQKISNDLNIHYAKFQSVATGNHGIFRVVKTTPPPPPLPET